MTFSDYTWNHPGSMTFPGNSKQEYGYDALMRLTHLTAKDPGGNVLLDYQYEYDSSDNIVSKTTEHGTYSYGYDGASRLTSADHPTLADESYSYDAVGNRTSASNADGSITHNANNELTVYGDVEYEYDANGNMTEVRLSGQVMFKYHYNADNRLVKVEGGNNNTIAEFYYDPFERRLWKEVAGTRIYFFYSDEGLVAEYDENEFEIRSYGYWPDSTWTTDPLWLKYGGEYYFYQNDHLGAPQKLVAQNGAVVWSAQYRAFGEASIEIDTVTNNLRFPGQYYDAETGLHYNWFRYYAPGIGRYVKTDPIGFNGRDLNLYRFVLGNPINKIDTDGRVVDWNNLWAVPYKLIEPIHVYPCMIALATVVTFVPMNSPPPNYATRGPDFEGDFDHCYVSCLSSRLCGGATYVETAGDIFEISQTITGRGHDVDRTTRYVRDIIANRYGLDCAYKECMSCADCCDTLPNLPDIVNWGIPWWLYIIIDTVRFP